MGFGFDWDHRRIWWIGDEMEGWHVVGARDVLRKGWRGGEAGRWWGGGCGIKKEIGQEVVGVGMRL